MDSDEERNLSPSQSKQYGVLRADLSAALAAFDRAQDWADLIHDLQRVNRVLNKNASSNFLPEKALLAKRLSQCLTTSLPSGVHLKALETYHLVFKRIGPARLARDLPLYAGGLFPLFSHCSTSLKAPLLSLYETHFIPLGLALRPVLDGFVLAVLPGVEDESSEFFTRSMKLLHSMAEAVGEVGVFARSLWRALLLSPPTRLSAANYLRLKLSEGDDALRKEMVSDMPLVAYAITAALSDEDALTQRSVLDLLLGELVVDSKFFQRTGEAEREAAVAVVGGLFGALIKRDMSLTKRVHAWLLGGKEGEEGIAFCEKFSSELILAAIDSDFAKLLEELAGKSASYATRPCRIAAALMDRAELAQSLGHHFALRVLKYGMVAVAKNEHEHERDIRRAIADLLQDLGSAKVFAELERMLASELEKSREDFELLAFALSLFPTKIDVVRNKHLPALLRVAVDSLDAVTSDSMTLDRAVAFCGEAIKAMGLSHTTDIDEGIKRSMEGTVSAFASFFVAWLAQALEAAPAEMRRAYSDVSVGDEYVAELKLASMYESRKEYISLAKGACSFFVAVAASEVAGIDTLRASLQATAKCATTADVRISLAGVLAFTEVSGKLASLESRREDHNEQVLGVIRRCWRQMHPSLRTATPQSAHALLGLQRRFPEETKIVIADGILSTDLSRRLRNLERFACLWRLAVEHRLMPLPADDGLFLMLDALTDEDWAPKMLARSWLSDALEIDAPAVLDAPLRLLLTTESRTIGPGHEFTTVYDAPRALYGFQILRGILECCATSGSSSGNREREHLIQSSSQISRRNMKRGRSGILALSGVAPSVRTNQALVAVFALLDEEKRTTRHESSELGSSSEGPVALSQLLPVQNYVITVALTCLGYLRGRVPSRFANSGGENGATAATANGESRIAEEMTSSDTGIDDTAWLIAGLGFKSLEELHACVCAAGAECLATLFRAIPVPSQLSAVVATFLAKPVLTLVQYKALVADPVLQLHFLDSIAFLVTADGPCYSSSVDGKTVFTRDELSSSRISFTENQNQPQLSKHHGPPSQRMQVGAVETLKDFIPWLLNGVAAACRSPNVDHDGGSREVLGVRRRWTEFVETVFRHLGVTLPVATEGLLLILSGLLSVRNGDAASELHAGDSEFSRVDETLVLLEGLAVILSNVLWSFEYALTRGDLNDDSQTNTESTVNKSAQQASSVVNDAFINVRTEPKDRSGQLANGVGVVSDGVRPRQVDGIGHSDRATHVTAATAAVINAINPLRMFNDFVKDVLSGSGSEGTERQLDPRRASARLMFCLLPDILRSVARVWGPASVTSFSADGEDESSGGSHPPRLSAEIPRERRQAQRTSVLAIIDPVFELRPVDVIAAAVALFSMEQNESGSLDERSVSESSARMACDILHAMDDANLDIVVSAVKTIFEKAVKWDSSGAEAKEGRAQASLRKQVLEVITPLIESGGGNLEGEGMNIIGRMGYGENGSSLPGGTVGLDISNGMYSRTGSSRSRHDDLFHWGDYFAVYESGRVETASVNFLEYFLRTSRDVEDIKASLPIFSAFLKDAFSSAKRKGTSPALLKTLGSFVSRCTSPLPDRREKKDVMNLATSATNACSALASGSNDVLAEEQTGDTKEFKKRLSVVSLEALAVAVPILVDSSFLDDKPQLTSTVMTSLSPASSTLRKAAARAMAIRATTENFQRARGAAGEMAARQMADKASDVLASKAAADIILNVARRDWGVKFARRELLGLLEDPNFFYGKHGGVLEKMSAVVREVVAGGGAASLLASIGSPGTNGAPGIPSLFAGRDSETVLRARSIRRVAFCVFVSEPDFYSPQLPVVLERLRDALRIADAGLVVECLLCLRALLLRTGPSSISAFRATTLSELFRIAANPTDNLNATIAALKFLDLTTLISPADYGYERCFFFGEETLPVSISGSGLKPFKPFAFKLSSLWSAEGEADEEMFASPLRLECGRTVLPGKPPLGFDEKFVGRYAAALMRRNSMPKMKSAAVDIEVICSELEQEFVM